MSRELSEKTSIPILETRDLVKRFGGLVAVNRVNMKILRNKITLLIGPNGAGKTTFVNLCTGVLKADEGRIIYRPDPDGSSIDITDLEPHKRYKMGIVRTFQIPQPFLSLTVLDNVLVAMNNPGENPLIAPIKNLWRKSEEENISKALNILRMVGLEKNWDQTAKALGAGQLKMLEVARALATGANLIILDEPIGGTDPAYAHEIFKQIRKIRENSSVSFLVIEHRIDIALPFADYVYVMDRGRVIAEGDPQSIVNNPQVIEVYIG
ncbi:MAG: ABC transporter ATP-binding protein [Sulfolobales archaeon]